MCIRHADCRSIKVNLLLIGSGILLSEKLLDKSLLDQPNTFDNELFSLLGKVEHGLRCHEMNA
jgi:hypothetical protein